MKKRCLEKNKKLMHQKSQVGVLVALLMLQLVGCQSVGKLGADPNLDTRLANPKKALEANDKIADVARRESRINDFLAKAELAWNDDNYDELIQIYTDLEVFDPGNLRSRDGLIRVEFAKKHQLLMAEAELLIGEDEIKNELAMAKLHEILLENPRQSKALKLYRELLTKKEQLTRANLSKKLTYNKSVSMEFRDVEIKKIFEGLAKTTKINFILDKDVPANQKATIFVDNMAFKDALDLLLQTNQLEKKVLSDNSVIIYVNDPLRQREYKDLIVRSYNLDYANAKDLSNVLRNMLGINQIEVDTRLNMLTIKDSQEVLALAEKMIESQDFPDAEVMLEVQVMEVKRSYLQNLGVNTPGGISLPVPSNGVLTIKDLKVSGNSLVVNGVPGLVFNTTNGDVSLLANPRIRVKNKETANIHIGEKVPVFTSNVASTGVTSQSVQYIDAGLKLEVEPQISTSGDVTIKVNLNVNSIGDKVTATAGDSQSVAFRVGTRSTTTTLRLHDGETQILAGLIDDQERKNISGIAGLSKIPLLGKLFSAQADDKVKTEIILSITPHIIRERKMPTSTQSEMWVGSEGRTGRRSPAPRFTPGVSPFNIPSAPPVNKGGKEDDKPKNINIKIPENFSLGNGLGNSAKPAE